MNRIKLQRIDQLIEKYCSKEWIYIINQQSTERFYKAKTIIFNEGDKVKNISIVKNGKVKIYSLSKKTERIYRFATNGQIIGHRGLTKELIFPASAFTLSDTTITDIPLPLFQSVLKANSLFCYHFMMFFAEELKESEKHIKNMDNMDIRQRIAQALIVNADFFGFEKENKNTLAYTLSRKDISYFASTTYESVIRTLSQFQSEEIIQLLNKDISIVNIQKLIEVEKHG